MQAFASLTIIDQQIVAMRAHIVKRLHATFPVTADQDLHVADLDVLDQIAMCFREFLNPAHHQPCPPEYSLPLEFKECL